MKTITSMDSRWPIFKVTRRAFNQALAAYHNAKLELPEALVDKLPPFEEFIMGKRFGWPDGTTYSHVAVSADGVAKIKMLSSPHATTLLATWLVRQ